MKFEEILPQLRDAPEGTLAFRRPEWLSGERIVRGRDKLYDEPDNAILFVNALNRMALWYIGGVSLLADDWETCDP